MNELDNETVLKQAADRDAMARAARRQKVFETTKATTFLKLTARNMLIFILVLWGGFAITYGILYSLKYGQEKQYISLGISAFALIWLLLTIFNIRRRRRQGKLGGNLPGVMSLFGSVVLLVLAVVETTSTNFVWYNMIQKQPFDK
jgi:hypothetical protein